MSPWIVLLIVLLIIVIGLAVLYFLGKKAQKKQEAQQEQIEAAKQTIPMLIIDKKRLPIKESGLPQMVIDQTPKLMRRSKLPIVKAKVGPRIMTLVADEQVFDLIPVKKEVKADVSGIYITGVKGVRGSLETPPKKQGFFKKMRAKANQMTKANIKKLFKKSIETFSSESLNAFLLLTKFFMSTDENLLLLLTVREHEADSLRYACD